MPKKKGTPSGPLALPPGPGGAGFNIPGVTGPGPGSAKVKRVRSAAAEELARMRREFLVGQGVLRPRGASKYAGMTPEQRKAAKSNERKAKRLEKNRLLEAQGLGPRKIRRSPEERKAHRTDRRQKRRTLFQELTQMHPDIAKRYGIDPARFKKPKAP